MNGKTIKQIAFVMLFIVIVSGASRWFKPAKKTPAQANVQIKTQTASQLNQPSGFRLQAMPNTVTQQVALPEEDLARVKSLATNEEDILDWLRNWARRDPESALSWAERQPDGVERKEALTDACFQINQTDPVRAVTLAERLNLNGNAVLENLARQWADKDLTAAYNWMVSQPANDYRDAFASGMACVLAQKEPVDAARFVVQEIPSGSVRDEAVMMVLHQWALVDLSGATTWVEKFPEGQLQNRAFNELLGVAKYEQSLSQSK